MKILGMGNALRKSMKTWIVVLIVALFGWGGVKGVCESEFDIELSVQPQENNEVSDKAKKQAYYKKYLSDYRFRTAQHRTFYKNGF